MQLKEKYKVKIQNINNGIIKKMIISGFFMPITTLLSLIYTRKLLQFLDETNYGIWITISSLAQWVFYFDVGIGNGMRNELAKEIDFGNYENAKRISSTSYCVISIIAILTFMIFICISCMINFDAFFKSNIKIKPIIILTSIFVCTNFVLSLCKSQLYAQQYAEFVGLMNICVHLLQLIGLMSVSMFFREEIIAVAIISGLSVSIVNIVFSIILWKRKSYCKPSYKYIDMKYFKKISTLGIRFFILQIGCLIIYSTDNLIITSLFGPADVTAYNTVYKIFNLLLVAFTAFISPVWSNITIETNRKNYEYIKNLIKSLNILMLPICVGIFILIIIFPNLSNWWLGKELFYEKGLIFSMGIFVALNIYSSIFSSILNGMGELNIQLFVAVFIAILNIPLSIYLASSMKMGVTGIIFASNICMIISTLTIVLQVKIVLDRLIKEKKSEL